MFTRILSVLAALLAATSPALAQDFTILVTSVGDRAVVRFDQDGTFLNYFVYPGSGNLIVPLELTFGPDGSAYVSNRDGDRISHYTPEGGFIGTFAIGSGLDNPHGLEFGPDGHLYVAGELTNTVLKFDGASGAFLGHLVTGLDLPVDLEFAPNGDLVVADRTTIRRYNAAGVLLQSIPFSEARGITLGPDGALYISDVQHARVIRVVGFNPATASEFVPSSAVLNGGLLGPYGLRFGPDGHLYVVSNGTNHVLKYNGATGAFMQQVTSIPVSGAIYVAFGPAAGSTLSPQVAVLQQQVAALLAENAALRQQADQLPACIAVSQSLANQVSTLQGENQQLRDLIAARDAIIGNLQEQLGVVTTALTAANGQVAQLQQQVADLEEQLANSGGDTSALRSMIASLTTRVMVRKTDANVAEAARAFARHAIDHEHPRNKKRIALAERHYKAGLAAIGKKHYPAAVREFRLAYAALKP